MNALANVKTGKYLNEYFVSSFQKVATFRIVGGQKQGGNVASYFCAPDGRVLHIVAGPVDGPTLLREAQWVVETTKKAMAEANGDGAKFKAYFRKAHAERLRQEHHLNPALLPRPNYVSSVPVLPTLGNTRGGKKVNLPLDTQGKVHLLLATYPMPRVEQIYRVIFQQILNQSLSTLPVVKG